MWEDKRLRDITEADVRQLVNSGLEEHLQLEYKSALYDDGKDQARESLLDICMFANAGGGILLIGVSEQRDENGQATGVPDPTATLGVEISNPEQLLLSYDARVVSNIQERLPVEMSAIPIADRYVVAIRVPNSMSKPHRVHYQGRVNFPSRRERHKYETDVREIKEMVMRTASRLEGAQEKLRQSRFLFNPADRREGRPTLVIGTIPIFWENFMVDIQKPEVIETVTRFHLGDGNYDQPSYDFYGLQRTIKSGEDSAVYVQRDGTIILNKRLREGIDGQNRYLQPTEIDRTLKAFVQRCSEVYAAAGITGPFLLTILLRIVNPTVGRYAASLGEEQSGYVIPRDYHFPIMQTDNLVDVDRVIRPLCDQAHQMFGHACSPFFEGNGVANR